MNSQHPSNVAPSPSASLRPASPATACPVHHCVRKPALPAPSGLPRPRPRAPASSRAGSRPRGLALPSTDGQRAVSVARPLPHPV
eukprot:4972627-Prymnesium_polylepis.1